MPITVLFSVATNSELNYEKKPYFIWLLKNNLFRTKLVM